MRSRLIKSFDYDKIQFNVSLITNQGNSDKPIYHYHQIVLIARIHLTLSLFLSLSLSFFLSLSLSLFLSLYRSFFLVGTLDSIQCSLRTDECKSLLVSWGVHVEENLVYEFVPAFSAVPRMSYSPF